MTAFDKALAAVTAAYADGLASKTTSKAARDAEKAALYAAERAALAAMTNKTTEDQAADMADLLTAAIAAGTGKEASPETERGNRFKMKAVLKYRSQCLDRVAKEPAKGVMTFANNLAKADKAKDDEAKARADYLPAAIAKASEADGITNAEGFAKYKAKEDGLFVSMVERFADRMAQRVTFLQSFRDMVPLLNDTDKAAIAVLIGYGEADASRIAA